MGRPHKFVRERNFILEHVLPSKGSFAPELGSEILEALQRMKLVSPTSAQEEIIPALLSGQDVVAQAATGSGKTIAYLIPAWKKLRAENAKELQVVVITPTRELAYQVHVVAEELLKEQQVFRAAVLAGGADVKRQIERLKQHPQLVVGTPGRILELIKLKKLTLHHVKLFIVDEIDQILRLGSKNELQELMKKTLRDCQYALLSATVPQEVMTFAKNQLKNPAFVRITGVPSTSVTVSHMSLLIPDEERIDSLRRMIRNDDAGSVLVFVNHTNQVPYVVGQLAERGITVEGIHSDSSKLFREQAMKRFRSGQSQVLVSTDLAARGLDIQSLTHVIHYGLPLNADQYRHRSGRIGRVGQTRAGKSILMLNPSELSTFKRIQNELGLKFEPAEFVKGILKKANPTVRK